MGKTTSGPHAGMTVQRTANSEPNDPDEPKDLNIGSDKVHGQ